MATRRILVVEDESAAREAIRRYLELRGHAVRTAANEAEALAAAADDPPDIVVCDWRLDGSRDGTDVARQLQSRHGCDLVFVTAYPVDELRSQTRDLRVLGYLRKPMSLDSLADLVAASKGPGGKSAARTHNVTHRGD